MSLSLLDLLLILASCLARYQRRRQFLEKLNKQRNLAQHLLNYSIQCSEENPSLNIGSIGTFFSVGETEDKRTASLAMIALSNICSLKYVRDMMAEMNCMHKFSGIVALLHGASSNHAASLLF